MKKKDINNVMQELHKERAVFWSEADFQYAFAWKLQQMYPDVRIRLERRYDYDGNPQYIDVWVELGDMVYPIELKYKTASSTLYDYNLEYYNNHKDSISLNDPMTLKEQGAQDTGRYDFLKDIQRIENIRKEHKVKFERGYTIILTNDYHYYEEIDFNKIKTLDRNFRIHQGQEFNNTELHWVKEVNNVLKNMDQINPNHWTKRYPPLRLAGKYTMDWQIYSEAVRIIEAKNPNIFMFCICEIK